MFPLFSYIIFYFLLSLPIFPAIHSPDPISTAEILANDTWHGFMRFLDAGNGSHVDGMADLKRYFHRFGYLPQNDNGNFTDIFDDEFKSALISYQKNLGLPVTGKLDNDTMNVIVSPRCGIADSTSAAVHRLKTTRKFAFFYGEPRWMQSSRSRSRSSPMMLTYAFSNTIDYLSQSDVKSAFRRAFARWSAVIPVNFTEAEDYTKADVKIGWHSGDHGDGEAFDGVLGVLAHAFSPENGRLHLDAAERWAVDFAAEKSRAAVDLESVATHEIGHVLGLAHSSVKEAIMYPSLSPRTKKVELRMDDVSGIQALYGSNPNYRYNSRLESDTSSCWGMTWSVTLVIVGYFFSLGL